MEDKKRKLMKKILCVLLAILLISTTLAFGGCGDNNSLSENKTANCVHEYVLYSSTATCTKAGTETYKCLYCEKTISKETTNPSHAYEKNKCSTCGDTITDIKNLSTTQKKNLYESLEYTAPFIYDDEALSASQDLYLLCESDVESAEAELERAKTQRTVRVYTGSGWIMVADEKAILQAQNALDEAQELLELSKLSYELVCEGYAWHLAVYHIKNSSDVSNQFLKEKLVLLIALYTTVTDSPSTYIPTWYGDITTAIKTIIGIDITE